jgi:4-amino-4-deoxy-L-arabinose transferase-like glycosyltransferase
MHGGERGWWFRLAGVTAAGAVLRFAYVLLRTRYDEPLGDQLYYSAQAIANAGGNWFEQPFEPGMPAADHPPLTALVLTPITAVVEGRFDLLTFQRLQMAAIGLAVIVVVGVLGRAVGGDRVGLAAAGLAVVHIGFLMNDGLLMSETIATLVVAGTMVVWFRILRTASGVGWWAFAGVLAGLAALTRPELAVLVPVTTLVVAVPQVTVRSRLTAAAVSAAAAIVVVAPWVLWNQARFEDTVTLSTNDGLTIAGANCDSTYFGDDLGGWDIWCAYAVERPDGLDASQESRIMREAGLRYWRDNIDRYPVVAVARAARVLGVGWLGQTVDVGEAEGRPGTLSWIGIVQWWFVAALAFVGWRRVPTKSTRWILVALLPYIVVVALMANAYPRFRVPAEIGVLVLAAIGVVRLFDTIVDRRASRSGALAVERARCDRFEEPPEPGGVRPLGGMS